VHANKHRLLSQAKLHSGFVLHNFRSTSFGHRSRQLLSQIRRPGVPQGKHPHFLLGGGLRALENLFPGFGNELLRAGAEPVDPDLLQTLDGDSLATLAPTFLSKSETLIADPWAMSAIPDFIYPQTIGERPPDLEDRLNFQSALDRLAARDVKVHILLIEIRHLLKPLNLLEAPAIVRRVKEEMVNASSALTL
jgi:hypothetical protein